jgi:hypothetical protein
VPCFSIGILRLPLILALYFGTQKRPYSSTLTSIVDSSVQIYTSAELAPCPPPWFGEVVVIITRLKKQGVLSKLCEQVRFAQRRFGCYTDHFKQPSKQDGAKQRSSFECTSTLAKRELDLPDALLDLSRREMIVAQNYFMEMPVFDNCVPLNRIHAYSWSISAIS